MEKLNYSTELIKQKTVEISDKEKTLERAHLYKKFGKVALALAEYEKVSETVEEKQADALVSQIEDALKIMDISLANQVDYSIVNHRQINTKEALESELQGGSSIPELDIRFDKEGKPWISHSPRAGARFWFSKPIHELGSERVAQYGERLSLEDGLELFQKYMDDNNKHRVVLELKELGGAVENHGKYLQNIKELLDKYDLSEQAIFATLSPSILKSTHDVFPNNAKILNGGIAPIISYDIAQKTLDGGKNEKEFALKVPNVELFLSNSSEVKDHVDGYGKQTGYLWTRLPKNTMEILAGLSKNGNVGAASLTLVNKFANILDKLSPKTAQKLREHYATELDRMGLQKQVAIDKRNPIENIDTVLNQMGENIIFYSDVNPGEYAGDLAPRDKR